MTDNEIIKALECCTDDSNGVTRCERCPYQTTDLDYCIDDLLEQALDLINRQQAKIERLNGELITEKTRRENAVNAYHEAKAEAIKEFAERLHTEILQALESNYRARAERERKTFNFAEDVLWSYCSGKVHCLDGLKRFVNDLVKEMVGVDE